MTTESITSSHHDFVNTGNASNRSTCRANWVHSTVREIAAPIRNAIVGGPFGSELTSKDYALQGIPVIRGQNMGGKYVSGSFVYVSHSKARNLEANLAKPRDIIFTQRGTLGQVCLVPDEPYEFYLVSQSQMKLSADYKIVDPFFLYYVFSSELHQDAIRQNTIQTGVPHINLSILRSLAVSYPPLHEQKAIAEVLTDADALIESLEQLLAKKRLLKQGVMQELLSGKTRLSGFEGEWEVIRLGDHVTFIRNGVHSRAELTSDGPVKYLHYGDIHAHAGSSMSPRNLPSLPVEKAKGLGLLINGDLIFADASEDIEGVGKSVEIFDADGVEVVPGLHTIAARFDKSILADGYKSYLQYCPEFIRHIKKLAAGTKVYATNRAHIASVEMRLPGIKEQASICSLLSDMDSEIDALEKRLTKARLLKQGMMQELLTGRVRLA